MKVSIENVPEGRENEVIIRCHTIDESVRNLIRFLGSPEPKLLGELDRNTHLLDPGKILYIESFDGKVFIHDDKLVCGIMLLIMAIYLRFGGRADVSLKAIWEIILLGATAVFRAESLVNFHKLEEQRMHVNYIISSILSDVFLLLLAYMLIPREKFSVQMAWVIVIVYFVSKGLYYFGNYMISLHRAREINSRLKKGKIS